MTTIGTRQLRASLAGYVRRAEAGERFTITVGNRAVAQLSPVESHHFTGPESMEGAARLGLVEPPLLPAPLPSGDSQRGHREQRELRRYPSDVRVDRILRQVRG